MSNHSLLSKCAVLIKLLKSTSTSFSKDCSGFIFFTNFNNLTDLNWSVQRLLLTGVRMLRSFFYAIIITLVERRNLLVHKVRKSNFTGQFGTYIK